MTKGYSTNKSLYRFYYMAFVLVNAPATFIRMSRSLLSGVNKIATYMDNMCVHNSIVGEDITTLSKLFQRISNAGLTTKPAKLEIVFKTITFLCYPIHQGYISIDNNYFTNADTQDKETRSIPPPGMCQQRNAISIWQRSIPCSNSHLQKSFIYFLGSKFTIQTDNQPLKILSTGIPKNNRIARRCMPLQD